MYLAAFSDGRQLGRYQFLLAPDATIDLYLLFRESPLHFLDLEGSFLRCIFQLLASIESAATWIYHRLGNYTRPLFVPGG